MDGSTGVSVLFFDSVENQSRDIDDRDFLAQDKPAVFYERLHEALDLLVEFFYAEEKGLPYELLRCETFLNVEERLQYHKTDTALLIDRYYQQRLQVIRFLGK